MKFYLKIINMKMIEWFWNIIFYNLYRFDLRLRELFNYLNPFILINNIPVVKKYHAKQGVDDMNKLANHMLSNPEIGVSIIWTSGFMGVLLVLIEYGIFNIIQILSNRPLIQSVWSDELHFFIFFTLLLAPIILVNQYLLFKKNKYLDYFKEFETMTKRKKTIYAWLSFFAVTIIFSFFIGSFLVL